MVDQYKKWNTIIGWMVFVAAATVYVLTSEPTASFWDCGEYIASSYKLQVGHPPGAPFFQLMGRFFSLFAGNNTALVARMVNTMSALASGFTILFMFWSMTLLGRKFATIKGAVLTDAKVMAIFGSAIVGSLAYTFSDSFWFSAVEGEVYASSSFLTAITFWTILKWEENADDKRAFRWLILMAYIIGLSIGVHLLNLLCIPAIVFVYYFKNYTPTRNGVIVSSILSLVLLAGILFGIIPWIVKLSGMFERLFVNSFSLPFGTGTLFYFALLIAAIVYGVKYSIKHHKVVLNTIILSFTFLLIGYSTFLILVIRSNALTPLNENKPDSATGLVSYLERDQYGSNPLLYGQYYNAPVEKYEDGNPVFTKAYVVMSGDKQYATFYEKNSAEKYIQENKASGNLTIKGKYIISDDKKNTEPKYDDKFCTPFPRMWSSEHADTYESWGNVVGTPISVPDRNGETKTIKKPTMLENLSFFFNYQIGVMYVRYFMWNFSGRQNDIQFRGERTNGNWITGIKVLDEWRVGPQDNIPDGVNNKGTNKFYLLPLILGIIGLWFHFSRDYKSAVVVLLLFFMTGIAIEIYLNMYAYQPRERDYAFVGSFYAYAMWIGFGVYAIWEYLSRKLNPKMTAIIVTVGCFLLVPTLMAKDGWDDHDRSGRYTCLNFAENYLNSCAPNAILFTNGDNDTFPLWYAQEVEGIRTDVRVLNLSLLNTDWYIDQAKRKAYKSEPVPFSLTKEKYIQGTRDFVYFDKEANAQGIFVNVKDAMRFVNDDNNTRQMSMGKNLNYFPTNKFSIPVDKEAVVKYGVVPQSLRDSILNSVDFTINGYGVQKAQLMVLDLLANFDWKRPVYFAITTGGEAYLGLENYFQLEGLTYRLVPLKAHSTDGQPSTVNTAIMYDNVMNKFKWGGIDNPKVYIDEQNLHMIWNFRNNFARLANALLDEGKKDSAIRVLDRCEQIIPDKNVPYNYYVIPVAEAYIKAGRIDKATAVLNRLIDRNSKELDYYFRFDRKYAKSIDSEKRQGLYVANKVKEICEQNKITSLVDKAKKNFDKYARIYEVSNPQPQQQQQGAPQPEQQQEGE